MYCNKSVHLIECSFSNPSQDVARTESNDNDVLPCKDNSQYICRSAISRIHRQKFQLWKKENMFVTYQFKRKTNENLKELSVLSEDDETEEHMTKVSV